MPEFNMEGLTDEQNAAIRSEIDRRVTAAVATAREKFETANQANFEAQVNAQVQAQLAQQSQQIEQSAEERVNQALLELAEQRAQIAFEQRKINVTRTLEEKGVDRDTANLLTPLIAGMENDESRNAYIENFVASRQNTIDSALEAQKQALAANAQPPMNNGGQVNQDINSQINSIYQSVGDPMMASAVAAQALINDSMK